MVTIRLPRPIGGKEILEAFRAAATFPVSPSLKWEAHGYVALSGYANEAATYPPQRGYHATPAYLREQGLVNRLIRGRHSPVWQTADGLAARFRTQVRLLPVCPSRKYSEICMEVHHEYDPGQAGDFKVAGTPDDAAFAQFRPAYDRIVQEFLRRIG